MNTPHTPESLSTALRDMTCGKPDEHLIHAAADMLYTTSTLLAQRDALKAATASI